MNKIEVLENGNVRITIPIALRSCAGRKKIVVANTTDGDGESLALTLARAFRWQRYIDEGKFKNSGDLALAIGVDQSAVARTTRLTQLAPELIHRVLNYDIPAGMTTNRLRCAFPERWDEQIKFFENP